jgi:THO complex subunit 4
MNAGPLKSAALNYDPSGRSLGTGTIVFRNASDAARAISEYHNRALDGKAMKIELIVNPAALASVAPVSSRLGAAPRYLIGLLIKAQ